MLSARHSTSDWLPTMRRGKQKNHQRKKVKAAAPPPSPRRRPALVRGGGFFCLVARGLQKKIDFLNRWWYYRLQKTVPNHTQRSILMRHHDPIPPGTRIGILGAGQLGKMIAIAAARLGYETVIWSPEGDIPAMQVASYPIIAPYDNEEALHRFVNLAAVATLEFENIPVDLVEKIAEHIPTRPNAAVLRVTQDRWEEKDFFQRMRIPITRTVRAEVVVDGHAEFPFPAFLKTCRLGYDGHGQVREKNLAELRDAYATLGHVPCVLEEEVDFLCEISVIAARGIAEQKHEIRCYPAVHNWHSNGILRETKWPSSAVTR